MSAQRRVQWVASGLVAWAAALAVALWVQMVGQHERWSRRSQENRYAFRSVPSLRGAIYDRTGTLLAWDEPRTQIGLHYQRFRLFQPVGAAVHLGTLLQQRFGDGTEYGYRDAAHGPEQALAVILAFPCALLQPGRLAKAEAATVATTLVTVLSAAARLPRKTIATALRKAAKEQPDAACGAIVAALTKDDLAAGFLRSVEQLRDLDRQLLAADPALQLGLLDHLDDLRLSVAQAQNQPGEVGLADRLRRIAKDVPFPLAAQIRLFAADLAGISVLPTYVRRTAAPADSSLAAWLGQVAELERALPKPSAGSAPQDEVLLEYAPSAMWREQVVPDEFAEADVDRAAFVQAAESTMYRELLVNQRRGISGLELSLDAELRGTFGMRFVERDKLRREQQLFGHLEVQAGANVQLSVDERLQQLAEQRLAQQVNAMRQLHASPGGSNQVAGALVVIDAGSGDLLAYASDQRIKLADQEGQQEWQTLRAPGIPYRGNASLGSLVKPFVLLEHLQAQARGAAHIAPEQLQPCAGKWEFGDRRRLGCLAAHGAAGRDPVQALAQSCNTFFFQVAMGLGEAGLLQAYARFGLAKVDDGPVAASWQERVVGLPPLRVARPRVDYASAELPMRGIGYGVYALPSDVARAYAGLATGRLPQLGVVLAAPREGTLLPELADEWSVVRAGLRAAVTQGTARNVKFPAQVQVFGKTGTAEVGVSGRENNAWFAGYVAPEGGLATIAFCAVLYWVPHGVHGGDHAAQCVADLLTDLRQDAALGAMYLQTGGSR